MKNVKLIRSTGNDFLDHMWRSSTSRGHFLLAFTQGWNNVEVRGEIINDDLALIRGLRILLQPYTGPAVRLYRGEPADEHYGISWSSDRKVANHHALRRRDDRPLEGPHEGSVLLETLAPPAAIIYRLTPRETGSEREFFVDYPRLYRVAIVRRYTCDCQECRDKQCGVGKMTDSNE
jgi:hypothetical protein